MDITATSIFVTVMKPIRTGTIAVLQEKYLLRIIAILETEIMTTFHLIVVSIKKEELNFLLPGTVFINLENVTLSVETRCHSDALQIILVFNYGCNVMVHMSNS